MIRLFEAMSRGGKMAHCWTRTRNEMLEPNILPKKIHRRVAAKVPPF